MAVMEIMEVEMACTTEIVTGVLFSKTHHCVAI